MEAGRSGGGEELSHGGEVMQEWRLETGAGEGGGGGGGAGGAAAEEARGGAEGEGVHGQGAYQPHAALRRREAQLHLPRRHPA